MQNKKTTIVGYIGLAIALLLAVKAVLLGQAIDFGSLVAALGVAVPSIGNILSKDGGH